MTPDELEEEYFRVMGAEPRDEVRAVDLLSEANATYAMLLNGMIYGYLEAWLHPTTSLLWVECGRNLSALMRAATPKVPHTQLLSAVSLLAGLGEAMGLGRVPGDLRPFFEKPDCPYPQLAPIAEWLQEETKALTFANMRVFSSSATSTGMLMRQPTYQLVTDWIFDEQKVTPKPPRKRKRKKKR